MKLSNLIPLSLTLALITSVLACEGGNLRGYTAQQSTVALNESQASQFISKSQARTLLAHSLYRFYGISDCRLDEFKRISIGNATELISQISFPEEGQAQLATQFLENHSDEIVALLGTVQSDAGPLTLLRLVYQPSLEGIPEYLGCSDGILFDLTSLGINDSPNFDTDSPEWKVCWKYTGSYGQCCHCSARVYGAFDCVDEDLCDFENCCEGGSKSNPRPFIDEYCPGFEDYFSNDEASIDSLSIGQSL